MMDLCLRSSISSLLKKLENITIQLTQSNFHKLQILGTSLEKLEFWERKTNQLWQHEILRLIFSVLLMCMSLVN